MIKSINVDSSSLQGVVRKNKLDICAKHLLIIVRSNLFRKLIIGMDRTYWLKGETKRTSKIIKLSNLEIYNLLMSGREEWNNETDYEIDLIVGGFWGKVWSKVLGFMNPGKPKIHLNYRYFDKLSKKKLCSLTGHEWTHTCGARHSGPHFRQAFSYFMNKVIEYCYDYLIINGNEDVSDDWRIDDIEEPKKPEYKTVCRRSWKTLWIKRCVRVRV